MPKKQSHNEFEKRVTPRKQAEGPLQKSEIKYKTLLANLPQKIFIKDQNLVYLTCNTNYADDLSITPEEIVGKTDYDFFPKDLADKYRSDDKAIMASGQVVELEEKYLKDGKEFIVKTIKIPFNDNKGNIKGIQGVFWDITKHKQAENALRESEKKYRFLAENITDVIWTMDMNLKYTYFSPSIERLQGYTQEEAINLSLEQRLTPDSFEKAIKLFNRELEKFNKRKKARKLPIKSEFEVIGKNRSTVPVEIEANFIIGHDGRPEGIIGVTRDITERKKAEKSLLRAHKQLDRRVKERTKELENQKKRLEEVNTALNVMLKKRDEDKQILEEKVMLNVKELIGPMIVNLKNSKLDDDQKAYIDTLETFLKDIVSPFSRVLHNTFHNLTPSEIRVANLIKDGKTTKEIAGLLNSTPRSVAFHRQNIREKLGISNRKVNLGSYLLSLLK